MYGGAVSEAMCMQPGLCFDCRPTPRRRSFFNARFLTPALSELRSALRPAYRKRSSFVHKAGLLARSSATPSRSPRDQWPNCRGCGRLLALGAGTHSNGYCCRFARHSLFIVRRPGGRHDTFCAANITLFSVPVHFPHAIFRAVTRCRGVPSQGCVAIRHSGSATIRPLTRAISVYWRAGNGSSTSNSRRRAIMSSFPSVPNCRRYWTSMKTGYRSPTNRK